MTFNKVWVHVCGKLACKRRHTVRRQAICTPRRRRFAIRDSAVPSCQEPKSLSMGVACCCMRGTPCPMETAFQTTASVERPAVLGAKRTTGEFRSWRVDSPFGWQLPSQTSGLKHLHQAHPKQRSAVHRLLQDSGLPPPLAPESQATQDSGGGATAQRPPLQIQH